MGAAQSVVRMRSPRADDLQQAAPLVRLVGRQGLAWVTNVPNGVNGDGHMTTRNDWTVDACAIAPEDHVLEIGCGRGVAVELVCAKLTTGKVVAIDRSAKMIALAEQRNRDAVASGKASFRTGEFQDAEFDGERYDKIFAVNVNVFWVRNPVTEMSVIRSLLNPGGVFFLGYEPPAGRVAEITERLLKNMADFKVSVVAGAPHLVGLKISI